MREIRKKENKNQEFFDLCKYIEREIFKYDENQKTRHADSRCSVGDYPVCN